MAIRKGTGLLMVWTDVPADKEPDFNRWYNEEHLAERLALPGFLNGARYEAVKGGPKHLAVYELDSVKALETDAYQRVRSNPTPSWTWCAHSWAMTKAGMNSSCCPISRSFASSR